MKYHLNHILWLLLLGFYHLLPTDLAFSVMDPELSKTEICRCSNTGNKYQQIIKTSLGMGLSLRNISHIHQHWCLLDIYRTCGFR